MLTGLLSLAPLSAGEPPSSVLPPLWEPFEPLFDELQPTETRGSASRKAAPVIRMKFMPAMLTLRATGAKQQSQER